MKKGLIVDLDRCVGCFTCEISCKQENEVPIGEKWIEVFQVGPYGNETGVVMDYLHNVSEKCHLCHHRTSEGLDPACVTNCPTDAILLLEGSDLLRMIRSEKHVQLCKVSKEQ